MFPVFASPVAAGVLIVICGSISVLFGAYLTTILRKLRIHSLSDTEWQPYSGCGELPQSPGFRELDQGGEEEVDLGLDVEREECREANLSEVSACAQPRRSSAERAKEIHAQITDGAKTFLKAEYQYIVAFLVVFGALLFVVVGSAGNCGPQMVRGGSLVRATGSCWFHGGITVAAFVLGGATSMLSGYIGMRVAVYTNARTACAAQRGLAPAFVSALRAGGVMGFTLTGLALLSLFASIAGATALLARRYSPAALAATAASNGGGGAALLLDGGRSSLAAAAMECVAGFGLGGSTVALFARVGGGIYTKAADVGADLVGKLEYGLAEDDARNPATIADNVGDNVGDVAGMGADLFGSFAEASCACMVIASSLPGLASQPPALLFPLLLCACGALSCALSFLVATVLRPPATAAAVPRALTSQLLLSTALCSAAAVPLAAAFLPPRLCVRLSPSLPAGTNQFVWLTPGAVPAWCAHATTNWLLLLCVLAGLWGGLAIGYSTNYMTSGSHRPVQELASVCREGAAVNIIYGLSLGQFSTAAPAAVLALLTALSLALGHTYGLSLCAMGMLAPLPTALAIDAYGPVCDNAGGIAEMAGFPPEVRRRTDVLDAAGNTTAAIGKGLAIGSAALVSLALYAAFLARAGLHRVDVLRPSVLCGLLLGSALPHCFSALCLRGVGTAAQRMVREVRRQMEAQPAILRGAVPPDTTRCVRIATVASLRQMAAPGALVLLAPLLLGFAAGVHALSGLLAGSLLSAVHVAVSSSNSGGAWDNAKKEVEGGAHGGSGSAAHAAAVIGDTVGDPLKDTSGPALNILMKLAAILSLVCADWLREYSLPALAGASF